jgi:hypothetical protein
MSFKTQKLGYESAALGNALRKAAYANEKVFLQESEAALNPIRAELYVLLAKSDRDVLDERTRAEARGATLDRALTDPAREPPAPSNTR